MSVKTWRERQAESGIGSCEARDEEIRDLRSQVERAFQMLDINGVTHDRAKYVSNGIDVLATRQARENADLRARCEKAEKDAAYRLDTLKEVRETLEVANVSPNGPINDTIWYSNCETLFDFMDAAIAKERT